MQPVLDADGVNSLLRRAFPDAQPGRRIAVCDVRLRTEGPERLVAQANVTYALPRR